MGRNSQQINQARHPDIASAAAQKSAEKPSHESHQQNRPERNPLNARNPQGDVWWQADSMNFAGDVRCGGVVALRRMFPGNASARCFVAPMDSQSLDAFP